MTARRMIVNADDFGANVKRTTGVVAAVKRGVVSSVSVLANGDGWGFAAFRNEPRLAASAGLHVNLSEGAPCCAGHRTLIAGDRAFLGKEEARRRLRAGEIDLAEVEREVSAQAHALLRRGVRLTHIDGHQHVHVFPGVAEVVARVAKAAGIACVRLPGGPGLGDLDDLPAQAAAVFAAAGLRSTDHFRGGDMLWSPSEAALHATIRALPPGTTELMVHPGHYAPGIGGPFARFSTPEREVELRALLSPDTRNLLAAERIELISFAEL